MAINYAQLNQGLRNFGGMTSNILDYQARQRQLDLYEQNSDREYEIANRIQDRADEAQAWNLRKERGQQFGNLLLQTSTEAANSQFRSLGEYLAGNGQARDAIVNGLASSNSRYRQLASGRELRTVPVGNGKFRVEALEDGGWSPVTDGQNPLEFNAEELTQAARLEAASYGRAELIRQDEEIQDAVARGVMTPEQGEARRAELSGANTELLRSLRDSGIPPEAVRDMELQGREAFLNEVRGQSPLAPQTTVPVIPDGPAAPVMPEVTPVAPEDDPKGLNLPYARAEPGDTTATRYGKALANSFKALVNDGSAFLERELETAWEDVKRAAKKGPVADFVRGFFGAPAHAAESAPTSVEVELNPNAENSPTLSLRTMPAEPGTVRPGVVTARTNQARREVSQISERSPIESRRRAAITYANAMMIAGATPNPDILANLEAGDNMRGDAKWQAMLALDWAKEHNRAVANAQDSPNARAITRALDNFGATFDERQLSRMNITKGYADQLAWTTYGANAAVLRENGFPTNPEDMSLSQLFLYTTALREALSQNGVKEGGVLGFGGSFRNTIGQLSDAFKTQESRINELLGSLTPGQRNAYFQEFVREDGTFDAIGFQNDVLQEIRRRDQTRQSSMN